MVKINVTLKFSYMADPKHYPEDDPQQMAEHDYDQFTDDVGNLIYIIESQDDYQLTVLPD